MEGDVDQAVFQSTYLKEWYTKGFNDIEQNAALLDRFPGKLIVNGRWDPRDGEAGLEQLEADHAKYGLQGVKLYTAEWLRARAAGSSTDPEAVPFLEQCRRAGHQEHPRPQGPDDLAAGQGRVRRLRRRPRGDDFPELNFIVEHVGLPRIEDFCFMATQEPNVYAGLSVVVGGLMHARPRFFAKVMGELLFWVGEDKMLFGTDYAIWEPKWQIEGLVDWDYPDDDVLRLPALDDRGEEEGPRPQRRQALRRRRCPQELQLPAEAARRRPATTRSSWRAPRDDPAGAGRSRRSPRVYDPELDEPITALGFVGSCVVSDAGDVDVHLRLPTPQCAPNFAFLMAADAREAVRRLAEVGASSIVLDDHYTGAEINAALARGGDFADAFPGETDRRAGRAARAVPAQGAARPPGAASASRCCARARRRTRSPRCASPTCRRARMRERCRELRARARPPARPRRRRAGRRRRHALTAAEPAHVAAARAAGRA